MRVLFTTHAVKSHLYNAAPMLWALRAAGHEVRVASQPDITQTITQAGLTAVPVGDELNLMARSHERQESNDPGYGTGYDIGERDPEKLTWEYVRDTFDAFSYIAEVCADQKVLEDLTRFARWWEPDLVLWDAMTFSGPVVARACGAGHARLLWGVDVWARMRGTFLRLSAEQKPEDRTDAFADWISERLASVGLSPEGAGAFDEELVVGQRTINPMPDWVDVPAELDCIEMQPVVYNGPATVPEWVAEKSDVPRVVLTLGGTLPQLYNEIFPLQGLLQAAADLDVELIATMGEEEASALSESGLPDNVRLVNFVPLNEILPTCSAIIHHGGWGTMHTALRHAVPQVIIPPGWLGDETEKAEALEKEGGGLVITPAEFTADTLREALTRVLGEPAFQKGADRLREELLAKPTPHDIVPELERLAAERSDRLPTVG